ncbi:hypothetical protein OG601_36555 [Streptomyces sp. NBC_01239]|nr:hypothetical protein [Streptomyces sp. NBC_01239]MCX4816118.1 hypothetical protein [Streptomyces sp. NBC_01239]
MSRCVMGRVPTADTRRPAAARVGCVQAMPVAHTMHAALRDGG